MAGLFTPDARGRHRRGPAMNIFLWVLQILLAAHTFVGALWKFAHAAQTVPSLGAIPHGLWLAMSVVELLCALCLILPPFIRSVAILAPLAAALIGVEMLFFCGLSLVSGRPNTGEMIYWLVVAAICAFIVYGRVVLKPLRPAAAARAEG